MTKTPNEATGEGAIGSPLVGGFRRGPGRPTIDNETFGGHRDALVWLLSVAWGDIGWGLTNATTPDELMQAFEPLREHPSNNLIAPFLRSTSTPATAQEVRSLKKAQGEAVENLRAIQDKHDNFARASQVAEQAMNETNPDPPPQLQAALFSAWKDRNAARKELEACRAKLTAIETTLADTSASFAQAELLDFVTRKKYARNPLVLANVMAGLPDMTWEHSHARASKIEYAQWPTYEYKVFTQIETIWEDHNSDPEVPLVQFFRQAVEKLPKTETFTYRPTGQKMRLENHVRAELCANWRFLRLAIEEIEKELPIDSGEVPFRILSDFRRNLPKPRTAKEVVLIVQERIE
jgi:hypothetical protein